LNEQIFQKPEKWKPNSLAVSLDFAKRNGLDAESEVLEKLLSDDGAHSQNEKLNKINYTNGMKVFANYIHRLGQE
jgi:acetylornithine deacetylase/succinyl-diaminopimelate desuccinylase-like protein